MDPTDRISMVRVTGEVFDQQPQLVRDMVRGMAPRSGDLLVVCAHPSRIGALERNLRAQLLPEGLVDD